jgi:WD40 repeat protein
MSVINSLVVNRDEHMEWSEFVMFVIEQVVSDKDFTIFEKFDDVNHHSIQPPASRQSVHGTKMSPESTRLLVGVGPELLIYNTNNQSETWLSEPDTLIMQQKGKKIAHGFGAGIVNNSSLHTSAHHKEDRLVGAGAKVSEDIVHECVDLAFLPSRDMLFVLRSDLCVEFHRMTSRTSFLPENMEHCGFWHLKNPHYRIQIRDMPEESWRLFIIGNTNEIESWLISVGERGHVEISDPQLLIGHNDYVRDILVIYNESYSIMASGSMDTKVMIWDLKTMSCKGVKTGHTAGVQCLAYDGRSTLFAGGFDYSIIGWDLDAQISKPVIFLNGHNATVSKLRALGGVDRCISLDMDGEIRFWDTSRLNPNDNDREISDLAVVEDHIRSFEVFGDVGSRFPTSHGMFMAAQGRRQHIYRVSDYADKVSPPLHVFLSQPLLMCITVHTQHIAFWSAVTGHEQNVMKIGGSHSGIAVEVTSAVLDDRARKLIVGDSNGHISVYNGLTAAKLKTFPALPFAVRYLIYTPDKTIIAVAGAGDLHVFDELPAAPEGNNDNNAHATSQIHSQLHLRETRAHEADVVAIAYSAKLGLIATADMSGMVVVWNYEFFTVEIILNAGFMEGEIGQLAFMDPIPLLAVTGSTSTVTLVPVSRAFKMFGRVLWKVQMHAVGAPELVELEDLEEEEYYEDGDTFDPRAGVMCLDNDLNVGVTAVISEIGLDSVSSTNSKNTPNRTPMRTPNRTPRGSIRGVLPIALNELGSVSTAGSNSQPSSVPSSARPGMSVRVLSTPPGMASAISARAQSAKEAKEAKEANMAAAAASSQQASAAVASSSRTLPSVKIAGLSSSSVQESSKQQQQQQLGPPQSASIKISTSRASIQESSKQGQMPPPSPSSSSLGGGASLSGRPASRKESLASGRDRPEGEAAAKEELLPATKEEEEDEEAEHSEDDDMTASTGSIAAMRKLKLAFSNKRVKDYLLPSKRRDARSIAVEFISPTVPLKPPAEDIISTTLKKILDEREAAWLAQLNIDDYDKEMSRKKLLAELKEQEEGQQHHVFHDDISSVPLVPLPEDMLIHLFIGYDDGTVAVCDLTRTIQRMDIGMVPVGLTSANRVGFNPRRTCLKTGIRYSEMNNLGWTPADIESGSVFTVCPVIKVWHPHGGAVTSLQLVGENNDVMTGSDDFSVQLFKNDSVLKGVLTRGREFDKLFRPRWKTPFNMAERAIKRKSNAEVLVKELSLSIREKKRGKDKRRQAVSQKRSPQRRATDAQHFIHEAVPMPTMQDIIAQHDADEEDFKYHNQENHHHAHRLTDDPDYIRAVGQLAGKITYHVSHRDVARTESAVKFSEVKKAIRQQTGGKKKGKKARKSRRASLLEMLKKSREEEEQEETSEDDDDDKDGKKNPFNDPAYMAEIMSDTHTEGMLMIAVF